MPSYEAAATSRRRSAIAVKAKPLRVATSKARTPELDLTATIMKRTRDAATKSTNQSTLSTF